MRRVKKVGDFVMDIRIGDTVVVDQGEPPALVTGISKATYRHGGDAGYYIDYPGGRIWTKMFPDIKVVA
jgi:hypothetical protein